MKRRGSGILLHITSLPSPHGIGDLGPSAYRFADLLYRMGQSFWQVLPLSPTIPDGHSPYNGSSAFAGNPLLISPDLLVRDGLLSRRDLQDCPNFPEEVKFDTVVPYKELLFRKAYERFLTATEEHESAMNEFYAESGTWLTPYAVFSALKAEFPAKTWDRWSRPIRDRNPDALTPLGEKFRERIRYEAFLQFIFARQWRALKLYCNKLGIQVIGDMPYYVSFDSADVWTHPDDFKLDGRRRPRVVSGVPPDYFSETGQLWGNPVYNWDRLKETGYAWWIRRLRRNLELFDILRIDHFRGMVAYWEVPAGQKTAIKGKWVSCPVQDFFGTVFRHFANPPLIAEDLGMITPDVREAIRMLGFPGIRVLLFAFGKDFENNPHIPHRVPPNTVYYTGTHDNNTSRGWFQSEASPDEKKSLFRYLGRKVTERNVHWELIRLAMMSGADTVIIPAQDLLGLGAASRMNRPATSSGNWRWRLRPGELSKTIEKNLREMTIAYGRL